MEAVPIDHRGFVVSGTLLLPEGRPPFPAALLLAGSKEQPRNAAPSRSGGYPPFCQIADALVARGVAVLRSDDRGEDAPAGGATMAQATTATFAGDARAEIAFLRRRADIDPAHIAIIGHGEGADIAAMIAGSDARLAAVVMIAGTGEAGSRVLERQLRRRLRATSLSPSEREAQVAEQQRELRAVEDGREYTAGGFTGPWLHFFLNHDVLAAVREVKQPLLILAGALDRQVAPGDARALAAAARGAGNANVTVLIFPGLNHLLLPSGSARIPASAVDALAGWLARGLTLGPSG